MSISIFRAARSAHIEIDAMLERATGMNSTRYEALNVIGLMEGATRNAIAEETGFSVAGVAEAIMWLLRQDWISVGKKTPQGAPLYLTDEGARVLAGARLVAIVVEQQLINRINMPLDGIVRVLTALSTDNKTEGSEEYGDRCKKESRA